MAQDKIETLCTYCEGINELSGSELYSAIKAKPSGAGRERLYSWY